MPMRAITAILLLLVALWIASPFGALWLFARAVDANDAARVESAVDWRSVRDNLKADVRRRLESEMGGESDDATEALARSALLLVGSAVAGELVEAYATPEALLAVLREIAAAGEGEGRFFDTVTYAFFSGPARFRVHLRPKGSRGEDAPLALIFTFQDFGWKLTRIELPLDELKGTGER